MWNTASLRRHCRKSGEVLYLCDTEDTVGKDHETPDLEQRVTIAEIPEEKLQGLSHRIEFAIGMRAMVTTNIATQADLANSSRGIIADIILDARERIDHDQHTKDGYVKLQYPPAVIIFEPYHHSLPKFEGLKEGQIPIFLAESGFTISTRGKPRTKVHHRQFPLVAAYAFTDHKAQGQTIHPVMVDIGPPPGNLGVSPFGAYVALSRGRGREQIRLLRDFDSNLFTRHPSESLRLEDIRLERLASETRERWDAGFYDYPSMSGIQFTMFYLVKELTIIQIYRKKVYVFSVKSC